MPPHAFPLVSVVVPSFNKRPFIGRTIESVQAQTFHDWELLAIDDASTDGSQELLADIAARDPRVSFVGFPTNRGANECRNRGIAEARGRYIVFLDADDLLTPDCLAKRVAVMQGSDLDCAVFTMQVFHEHPGDDAHRWVPRSARPLEDFLRHELPWQTMQPIWDRGFLERLGGFDAAFPRHQDVEMHTRALLQPGMRLRLVPGEPDCFYRIAEERKVFDPSLLLEKFSHAAVMYRDKFAADAERMGRRNLVLGIIQRTYLQVLRHAKEGRIDATTLDALESILFAPNGEGWPSSITRGLFRVTRWYNLGPVRIPGINRLLFELVTR
jgi:glycosyltransferase involved in cell wall biosynthesis